MPKFSPGDRVEIAFNPQKSDDRVPDQRASPEHPMGLHPGSGNYQTVADVGTVLEVRHMIGGAIKYLVAVELKIEHERNGQKIVVSSTRNREIVEEKLSALP